MEKMNYEKYNSSLINGFISFKKAGLFFLYLTFVLKALTDALLIKANSNSNLDDIKYIFLFVSFVFFLLLKIKNPTRKVFLPEFKVVLYQIFFLLLFSLFNSLIHFSFSLGLFKEIFLTFIPIFFVYLVANSCTKKDICFWFKITFLTYFFIYLFFEIGINNLTIENIMKINIFNSYSPFESSYSAAPAFLFCCFFIFYYRSKLFIFFSFVFCLLTFKRPLIFSAVLLLFLRFLLQHIEFKFSNKIYVFPALLFIATTIFYYFVITENLFHLEYDTLFSFTMGRSEFLLTLKSNNFCAFGLGSTEDFLGRNLEMDLIRIMLETNVFGLCIVCFSYFYVARKSYINIAFMFCIFITLLTSHMLNEPFAWILIYLIIHLFNENSCDTKSFKGEYNESKV